ncbi:MAG: glycosyltransferase [Acidobacteriota bacterium]
MQSLPPHQARHTITAQPLTTHQLLTTLFCLSAAWLCYVYVGYGSLVWLRRLVLKRAPSPTPEGTPTERPSRVSIIVALHNGEGVIDAKIADCLRQEMPASSLEVVVASDASTDATEAIARRWQDGCVRLVSSSQRQGKEAAQRRAIEAADSEILVFTDAAISLQPGALAALVDSFADPKVGCVSGVDRLADPNGRAAGESAFVRYDTWLKHQESLGGSTVGNSGWLFAIRRSLCDDWPQDLPSDFTMALRTVRAGQRSIVQPAAVAVGGSVPSEEHELRRKVRTMVRGMAALRAHRDLLDPTRHGFFAVQLWSHKILRWLLPIPMLGLLASSGLLALGSPNSGSPDSIFPDSGSPFFITVFAAQALFWALGIVTPRPRLPRYFAVTTAAALLAAWQYGRGKRYVHWQPSVRTLREAEEL